MKKPTRNAEPEFVVTMPMGLDGVAASEVAQRAPGASLLSRTSTELRLRGAEVGSLAALRSVNDAWVVVRDYRGIGPRYRDLHALKNLVSRTSLDRALALSQVDGGRRRTTDFALTCSMRGERAYRRLDALKACEEGLAAQSGGRFRPAATGAALRLWLHLEEDRARLCVALTPKPLHLRDRSVSLPTSLSGPVAYAMAHLTEPRADDVFVDPTCGSGSIALERGENWRHRQLLLGDRSHQAVEAAAANFGPRHKPRSVLWWDAAHLPLGPDSVDALACNPPHGIQMQPEAGLEPLYRGIIGEAARILRAGGRMTFLTPLREMTDRVLRDVGGFRIERCFVIDLLGQRPYLYSLRRR